MDTERLRKIFQRFTTNELEDIIKEWGHLGTNFDASDIKGRSRTKRAVASALAQICEKKRIRTDAVDELELIYIQTHSRSKLWQVYELQKIPGQKENVHSPSDFSDRLEEELSKFYQTRVQLRQKDEAYWIRINIEEAKRPDNPAVTYVVHFPHTQYLLVANLKVTYTNFIFQAFLTVLGCSDVVNLSLSGRCVMSLAQLAVNKNSQGSFTKFRLNKADANPLTRRRKRKRRASSDEELDCHIVYENQEEKQTRELILEDTFGSNPQPVLEKVEYRLETKFRGARFAPAMAQRDEIFHCKVKFEGPSVIEGIKNLGKCGLAELPMKDHLGKITSKARNVFVLKHKVRGQKTPSK